MKDNAIEKEWLRYRTACFPDGKVSPVQDRETRQAFFAGALVACGLMTDVAKLPDEDAEKALVRLMKDAVGGCKEIVTDNMRKFN